MEDAEITDKTRSSSMSTNDETTDLGPVLVLKPEEGKNFWQPQPANGSISVRIAPAVLDVQTPFSLGTQTLPPGAYVREHSHPVHDEVLHFISGRGKAVIDGVEHVAEPGVTIFVGRNRRHMFINTSTDSDLHWLWFIQPNGLEDFFEEIGRPVVPGEPTPEPFARPENVLEIEARTAFAPQPSDQRQPS
jgi:quercetin dioxygenase-like cupin family protein